MFYIFLAPGFEEVEALAPVDVLRRAGVEVLLAGVGGEYIEGSHGITVKCDIKAEDVVMSDDIEGIILPGGGKGTQNLEKSGVVQGFISFAFERDKLLCAICAAPSILGHKGILNGKEAICFPGFEKELYGAKISEKYVVRDGNIITAKGMGVATEFGLEIAAAVCGREKAQQIKEQIQAL